MSRLTKKTNLNNLDGGKLYKVNADYSKCEDLDDKKAVCVKVTSKIIDKLGQLEDIESEIGIDLITLFKALKNGFYARREEDFSKIVFYDSVRLGIYKGRFVLCGVDSVTMLWVMVCVADKDRWALTKEELE